MLKETFDHMHYRDGAYTSGKAKHIDVRLLIQKIYI